MVAFACGATRMWGDANSLVGSVLSAGSAALTPKKLGCKGDN
jgi:hypothetical protein